MNSLLEIQNAMIEALEGREPGKTGLQAFADEMGVPCGTAQVWRTRKSIHYRHHRALAALAARLGMPGITVERLNELYNAQHGPISVKNSPAVEGVAA